jgi:uncharacterized membrane protein
MRLNKKLIIIAVSVAVLLVGSVAGVVLAAGNSDANQSKAQGEELLTKVCTIYQQKTGVAIDETALKDAFTQAESEAQLAREQARLKDLVTQGKITQDQADQYLNWWQSRPNLPAGFGFGGSGGFPGRGAPCAPPATAPSTTQ